MADVKISELPVPIPVANADEFAVVQSDGVTRRPVWLSYKTTLQGASGRQWLELGTASTATLTTSAADATANRVVKVGDFGMVGSAGAPSATGADLNLQAVAGIVGLGGGTLNQPPASGSGSTCLTAVFSGTAAQQLVLGYGADSLSLRRKVAGAWQPWVSAVLANAAGAVAIAGPVRVGQYLLTTLPSAATYSGYEIDVTNATGGSKRCRSNGTVWQILNTTTTVS